MKLACDHLFSHEPHGEMSNLSQKFWWKIFFIKNVLFSLFQCEHVSHQVETVKDFHKHISGSNRHPKDSTSTRDFFKTTWKMSNFGQKIGWKKFFIKFFCYSFQVQCVLDLLETVKASIVVSQTLLNDTSDDTWL